MKTSTTINRMTGLDLVGIGNRATGFKTTTRAHGGIWGGYMVAELVVRSFFGYRVV